MKSGFKDLDGFNATLNYSPRAFHTALDFVLQKGRPATVGLKGTTEIVNSHLVLNNPRDRVVTSPGRKMNIAFGLAETYSMIFGEDRIAFFKKFISNYDRYSSDGETLDGCYGTRINFTGDDGDPVSQVSAVIDKLMADVKTRQAVISIYDRNDLFGSGGLNTPCTLSLQFLNRDGRLHLITTMRSNDLIRGLTYDAFAFTMLQEFVARALDLDLGLYLHNVGSFHIYDSDNLMVRSIYENRTRWPHLMDVMPPMTSYDLNNWKKLVEKTIWLDSYQGMTLDNFADTLVWSSWQAKQYIRGLAATMLTFTLRNNEDKTELRRAYSLISDRTLKHVLRFWLDSDIRNRKPGHVGK